jgi:hypothetical protein
MRQALCIRKLAVQCDRLPRWLSWRCLHKKGIGNVPIGGEKIAVKPANSIDLVV